MRVNAQLSPELQHEISALRDLILHDPVQVIDPPTQHHEFKSGMHGRKIDMDNIVTGSPFFWSWVATYARWIKESYTNSIPELLIGVANGGNRLATTMAHAVGATAIETTKQDGIATVDDWASVALTRHPSPRLALIIEDVGTTGSSSSSLIPQLQRRGIEHIEVAHTWIRTETLPKLDEIGIPYSAMIHEPLETFSPDDCATIPGAFCNEEIPLIPYGS